MSTRQVTDAKQAYLKAKMDLSQAAHRLHETQAAQSEIDYYLSLSESHTVRMALHQANTKLWQEETKYKALVKQLESLVADLEDEWKIAKVEASEEGIEDMVDWDKSSQDQPFDLPF